MRYRFLLFFVATASLALGKNSQTDSSTRRLIAPGAAETGLYGINNAGDMIWVCRGLPAMPRFTVSS